MGAGRAGEYRAYERSVRVEKFVRRSVALIKLVEFSARALLMMLCVYLLPTAEAVQFGTVMLFVGLFGFLAGFERYVDLQRRLHALSKADADAATVSFGRMVAVSYIVLLPLMYASLRLVGTVPSSLAVIAIVVAVVEHLSQECYRIVLVTQRNRLLLIASAGKTLAILAAVCGIICVKSLSIESVLCWWAVIGGVWLVLIAVLVRPIVRSGLGGESIGLRMQYARSGRHFAIGLVAILAVQTDRFVAINVLGVEDLAQYFRAVMTAGVAYQILTFGSFNRIALDAYRSLKRGEHGAVRVAFRRERVAYLLVLLAVPLVTEAARRFLGIPWIEATVPTFAVVALACGSSLVRGLADFESIVLNNLHLESRILALNALGACATAATAAILGSAFGVCGVLAGSVTGSCIVAVAVWYSARRGLAHLRAKARRA